MTLTCQVSDHLVSGPPFKVAGSRLVMVKTGVPIIGGSSSNHLLITGVGDYRCNYYLSLVLTVGGKVRCRTNLIIPKLGSFFPHKNQCYIGIGGGIIREVKRSGVVPPYRDVIAKCSNWWKVDVFSAHDVLLEVKG